MKQLLRSLLLAVALGAACSAASVADVLYPQLNLSNPVNNQTGVVVEQGKKAFAYRFGCFDAMSNPTNTCWPVLTGGTVTLTIPGPGQITCTPTASPLANSCGYIIANPFGNGFGADTVLVYYNGLLPVSTSGIFVNVDGATGSAASSEAACTPATCRLTFATGNNVPRKATSTELVFDISGSMAQPAVPSGTVQRMDALKTAAKSFFAAWQKKAMLGDKLGVVFFSTTATAFPAAVPNLVPGHDPTATGTLLAQINAQVPTASTAIGKGLQLANTNGFAADPDANPNKYVVLFTDGEQNEPPPNGDVGTTATAVTIGGGVYGPGINVCPVTAGNLTAVGFTLQQNIANAVCNKQNAYIQGINQTFVQADLQTYFTQLVATMLQGDKYEISKDVQGRISTAPVVTFLGNALDLSTTILINHNPRLELLGFRLFAPDGTEVNVKGRTEFYGGGSVTEILYPLARDGNKKNGNKKVSPRGTWKLVFVANSMVKAAAAAGADDYHVMVMVDNKTISSTMASIVTDAGTGEPLRVRATLRDGSGKLLNATVAAQLSGPNAGLGNVLSTHKVSGVPPTLGGDKTNSAGLDKLLLLYNDPAAVSLFGVSALPTIALTDTAHAGLYNGAFNNAATEGHYFFTFRVRGKSAGNGIFERTWKTTIFVRPKPYAPKTPVQVLAIGTSSEGTSATLRVTLHDKFGNYLGPGYDKGLFFHAESKERNIPFAVDNLDGSYTFRVQLYPADHHKLYLMVLGKLAKKIDLTGAHPGTVL